MLRSNSQIQKIVLAVSMMLAAFLIVFHFSDTPKVWVDEGVFTEVAKNIARHDVLGIQTAPGEYFPMSALLSTGYPVVLPVALFIKLFGSGVIQARLAMIIYMMLLAAVYYLFARKRYGWLAAIVSLLLLLSFSPFYGNGRPVQGEVPGLFFLVLGAYALINLEEKKYRDWWLALGTGLAFGLASATKPIYFLGLLGAGFITLCLCFKKIENKKQLIIILIGFLIPLAIQVAIQFPTREALQSIVPTYLHLASNHGSSLSVSATVLGNLKRFVTESTPLLFLLLLITIGLSFVRRMSKNSFDRVTAGEWVLGSFIILNVAAYVLGTGWYRYFFPGHMLLYLLFPGAIVFLAKNLKRPIVGRVLMGIPVLLIILQGIHLGLVSDTSFTVKRTRNAELQAVLSKLEPAQSVLFYNSIEAAIFLNHSNYTQYLKMADFLEAGNTTSINNPTQDLILANDDSENITRTIPCYSKRQVSRYYVFEKIRDCTP